MKWIVRSARVAMYLSLFLFLQNPCTAATSGDEQVNQCFACHTNPRKLIQITREIAESRKDEPQPEVTSEGEG